MDTPLDSGALLRDDRPPSPARDAPSPPLSARDPSPPPSPLLMTASPTREPSPNLTAGDSSVHQDQEPLSSTPRSADQEAANILLSFIRPLLLPVDALPEPDAASVAGSLSVPAAAASASVSVVAASTSNSSVFATPRPAVSAPSSLGERLLSLSAIARRFQPASPVDNLEDPIHVARDPPVDEDLLKLAEAQFPIGVPALPPPEDDDFSGREDMEITISSAAAPPVAALQGTYFLLFFITRVPFFNSGLYFYRTRVVASRRASTY